MGSLPVPDLRVEPIQFFLGKKADLCLRDSRTGDLKPFWELADARLQSERNQRNLQPSILSSLEIHSDFALPFLWRKMSSIIITTTI